MKLLVDMNLPPKFADMLVSDGIESFHWYNIGVPDAADSEIFSYAIDNECAIVTCDLDFSAILSVTCGSKPSVIQVRTQGLPWDELAKIVVNAVTQNTNDLASGAIISINASKSRIRLLPL